jgi:hypothetical protein
LQTQSLTLGCAQLAETIEGGWQSSIDLEPGVKGTLALGVQSRESEFEILSHTYLSLQMESRQPAPQERESEPEQASMTRTRIADPNQGRNMPQHQSQPQTPKADELPATHLA